MEPTPNDFERLAETPQPSIGREFWEFLRGNKKWWLLPLVVLLLVMSEVAYLSVTAAPFIYPL